jgi:hypothetical protein
MRTGRVRCLDTGLGFACLAYGLYSTERDDIMTKTWSGCALEFHRCIVDSALPP